MALAVGTRLGPYEVIALIGEGGMGQVYRATDTNLKRPVAIKILPEAVATDGDRLARFQREAEVLARLNHPNIAQIHGLEKSDGTTALVMELVEGPTLADRIAQGPIPVDETLPIAKQIAEALEAAHEQGIIHRDLKPANIKVRADGTVKVLDFGLAKAIDPTRTFDLTQSPTMSVAATRAGVIMGTAAYMAPEQAKGKPVDKRADIWAFGCVLYEMLTGSRAFEGDDAPDLLASVVRSEPDWDALPPDVPVVLPGLLRRCLAKDPRQRVRDIGDVRLAMEGAFQTIVSTTGAHAFLRPQLRAWQRPASIVMIALAVAIISGGAIWSLTRSGPPLPSRSTRFAVTPPPNVDISTPNTRGFVVSPDGRTIVFADDASGQLYRRSLDQLDAVPIRGAQNAWLPFFSPDGAWVAFVDQGDNTLKKARLDGSEVVTLCPVTSNIRSGGWGTGDSIVFFYSGAKGLWRVSAGGGEPELVAPLELEQAGLLSWIDVLPGGQAALATIGNENARQVVVVSLETRELTVLFDGMFPRYAPTGHIVYWRESSLWAVSFDARRLTLGGPPVPVLEGVRSDDNGVARFAVGGNVLAYQRGVGAGTKLTMVWVDRQGREEPLKAVPRPYGWPRISPDGTRVAVQVLEQGNYDVWIYDLARATSIQLTFDPAADTSPIWTPDGKRVVFQSDRGGRPALLWTAADGTGTAEVVTSFDESVTSVRPYSWSSDGMALAIETTSPVTGADVGVVSVGGASDWKRLVQTKANERQPAISPDGHWITYVSDETGNHAIIVKRFPGLSGMWNISTAEVVPTSSPLRAATARSGFEPVWGPNGRELFYRQNTVMLTVPVDTGTVFAHGTPNALFEGVYVGGFDSFSLPGPHYDLARDGQRFLCRQSDRDFEHNRAPRLLTSSRHGDWWATVRDWAGAALPAQVQARLSMAHAQLGLLDMQMAELDAQQQAAVTAAARESPLRQLVRLKGVAATSASVLLDEGLVWRGFRNRREVGGFLGFTPTPYDSGSSTQEQGISRAGNKRLQAITIQLAWTWVRWQPHSARTRWFRERFGIGKRARRIGIVAVARKLVIALWRFVTSGTVPEGPS